jgi:hypothetical protein
MFVLIGLSGALFGFIYAKYILIKFFETKTENHAMNSSGGYFWLVIMPGATGSIFLAEEYLNHIRGNSIMGHTGFYEFINIFPGLIEGIIILIMAASLIPFMFSYILMPIILILTYLVYIMNKLGFGFNKK